jgi:hypothetical protein
VPGAQHVDGGSRDAAPAADPAAAPAADLAADPAGDLSEQVGRLADRLRSLSDVRLAAALPGGGSRADAAHRLAQELADAAAGLHAEPTRPVPRLDDLVVGDQVAVIGTDLVTALRRAARDDPDGPWSAAARSALAAVRRLRDQT